jgi:outer membrane protein TolC
MPFVMPAAAPDPIAIALAPRSGGLTPEAVAKTVSQTKHSVRAKQADLQAASAKVDQAFVAYFPKVTVGASYTYLSPVVLNFAGALALAPGTPAAIVTAFQQEFKYVAPIALPVNNYSLTAGINVPVSDYVLRLAQNHAAATHNERSARLAAEAEALQAGADAKIAYFNWVRAKGAIVVSQEAIDQATAHMEDAKKSFAVGLASKADVLRVDAQVAAAQQALAESMAFASVAEEQLRILLGAPPGKPLDIGSDVMNEPAMPPAETMAVLQDQAMGRRLEIRSLGEAISSLRQVESVTKAGYAPRIDAFADATYANPNQRIFPSTNAWNGTWDAGVRLSWTLNDTFTTIGAAAEAKARTASAIEQRAALEDGLRTEVASAYADAFKAPATIAAADRGMVAAEESLRVRRELFRNGKATSTELLDAEGELTQARLRRLDAHIGLLVARARLDHAIGRDAPARPVNE